VTRIGMGLVAGLLLVLALAGCGGGDKGEGVASLGGGKATSTTNAGAGGGYERAWKSSGVDWRPTPRKTPQWRGSRRRR
jgi:hypothetical protein